MSARIVVIGAGIVGVTAAYQLAKDGKVRLEQAEAVHRRYHQCMGDPLGRRESTLGGGGTGAVDRHLPGAGEEGALQEALHAPAGEVLGLGEEGHPPAQRHRHEDPVGRRQVVAREDGGPARRHVLHALHMWPEHQLHDRADRHELEEPVEQHASLSDCQTRGGRDERASPRPAPEDR